jgi:hypothetical protein
VLGYLVDQSGDFSGIDEVEAQSWYQNESRELGFIGDRSPITRIQLAWLIDNIYDPFTADQVQIGFENPKLD